MAIPICVPALESGNEPVRVGTWLVESGQRVDAGDRLVELELTGMVYIVSTESSGRVESIEQPQGCTVHQGAVLAWIVNSPET